jgi:hypothetical protein
MRPRARAAALVAASAASTAFAGAPAIVSGFDLDDQGWSTDKDARDFRWVSSGGNPGGYVAADDVGTGEYWRFAAPDAYLGDLSAYYGQRLSYDVIQLGPVGGVTNQNDVEIAGPGGTLAYRFGNPPADAWTGFSVRIVAGAGWTVGGAPATEQQIRDVLAEVTSLSLRGEFRVGADSAGLDNVRLGDGCTADFNADGQVNFFDVSDYIAAYNAADADADLAEPFGTLNFFDVSAFIAAFNAGC